MARPYTLIVVCTGNICRSPMIELVLRERFEAEGLDQRVRVESAGTTSWEEGSPADPRTLAVLRRNGHAGIGAATHVARKFRRSWLAEADLVLAADRGHLRDLRRLATTQEERDKIRLYREFDPQAVADGTLDMDDPWYGDDATFDRTYAEVVAASAGLVDYVRARLE